MYSLKSVSQGQWILINLAIVFEGRRPNSVSFVPGLWFMLFIASIFLIWCPYTTLFRSFVAFIVILKTITKMTELINGKVSCKSNNEEILQNCRRIILNTTLFRFILLFFGNAYLYIRDVFKVCSINFKNLQRQINLQLTMHKSVF